MWRETPYSVVWWSPEPAILALGADAPFGLRRDDLIVKTVDPAVLRRHRAAYDSWRETRDAAIAIARKPSVEVITATETSDVVLPSIDDVPLTIETVGDVEARPRGPRFGSLVHALLADVPLTGEMKNLEHLAAAHGRILDAQPAEIAAAHAAVARVLTHPVLVAATRAARTGRCYRETPVTIRTENGTLIEGTVDLAFEEGGQFVVVDFKTDRELDGALEGYERQVRVYASAISSATGQPTRAVLMRL